MVQESKPVPMLHDEMGNDGLADVAGLHANMGGAAAAAEAGTDDVARQQPVATVSRYLRTWRTWDGASAGCLWPYRLRRAVPCRAAAAVAAAAALG